MIFFGSFATANRLRRLEDEDSVSCRPVDSWGTAEVSVQTNDGTGGVRVGQGLSRHTRRLVDGGFNLCRKKVD